MIAERGVPFTTQLRRAWETNPLIPPDKYNGIVRLLTFFADQLSSLCNQLVLERKNAEPEMVTRARAYIEQHRHEELSLQRVAAAAGASVYHFCKIFRRSTGLKFTDYVARVRIEEARTRLLNPRMRISEVAYDAGFQSLTQFNRTFRRVYAQSPTDFRAGLTTGDQNKGQTRHADQAARRVSREGTTRTGQCA